MNDLDKRVRNVVEGYEYLFDTETMEPQLLPNTDPDFGQYHFIIKGTLKGEDVSDNLIILINQEDGSITLISDIISYYAYVQDYVDAYVLAIRNDDKLRLAGLLNPDDLPYPILMTNVIIDKYRSEADVSKLKAVFDGMKLSDPSRPFRFGIEGDNSEFTHDIEIIHGDGLMGIRDEYIPEQGEYEKAAITQFFENPSVEGLILGSHSEEVLNKLGEPIKIVKNTDNPLSSEIWSYEGLNVQFLKDRIVRVEVSSDQYDTSFAAKVGYTIESYFGRYLEDYDPVKHGVEFVIENDEIRKIIIGTGE